MSNQGNPETKRKFNPFLALGIAFLPVIFVWFLLRRGHSTTARIVGFVWTAVFMLAAVSANLEGERSPSGAPQTGSVGEPYQLTPEQAAERRLRAVERSPENFLSLVDVSGEKGGFDTVFILSGTLHNSAEVDIKDAQIRCALFGPSGTELGAVEETLYEIVPANGDKRFSELNMGFMSSQQVARHDCAIVDAEAIIEEH